MNENNNINDAMSNLTTVQPYLFFEGKCEEAIEFYCRALGAQVQMQMRYKESPEPPPPGCAPIDSNKIMHAAFQIGSTVVMASDGRCNGNPKFEGFALSLPVPTEADADRAFNALADGGQVQMPLGKTFFSARFGMVIDRFGVLWMVLVHPPGTPPQHS
ncbi:MAG: VOC family protein [Verrucomicrobiota bacterium]|jgi:PhnB protein